MTLYPDVMRKAQSEIDGMVGRERMPNVTDREHLPYIEAIVREVLRWRPVGPMGKCKNTSYNVRTSVLMTDKGLPRQCTEVGLYAHSWNASLI